MKINVKSAAKVAEATCAATGILALSALVASSAAVEAIVEEFKSAKDTMKKVLADETEKETDETDETEKETSVDEQQRDDNAVEDNTSETL